MAGGRERYVALLRHDTTVLEADAKLAREVDTRLNRHHRARGHRLVPAATKARQLVNLDTHAVAETVTVVGTIARVTDDLDGVVVHVLADDVRAHHGRTLLVGAPHDVVYLTLLVTRLTHAHGAGHVGVIVVIERAVVHDDEVALLDHVLARLRVRVGAVGASGDDGAKAQAICAVGEHVVF